LSSASSSISPADETLLATLEKSFARLAGTDGVIDVNELQRALGLRSAYLAKRVLTSLDANHDGVVTHDAFMAAVRKLIAGSDEEKLRFAFRVHDHNDDGAISYDELHRMIAISLAEGDVAERPTQPATMLARNLFQLADRDRSGSITFDEFVAVVAKRPELLRKMTRSEALWIAPNEELIEWLDNGGKPARRVFPVGENGWAPLIVLLAWIAVNVGILVVGLTRNRHGHPINEFTQAGRAFGKCINFNGALLLIPVMRRFLSWIRTTFLGRMLPLDEAITFHRIVGHTLVALGIAHGAMLTLSYFQGHPHATVGKLLFSTHRGLTGALLLIVITIMWVFALSFVRRTQRFELFYFTHLLYVVWFALAIAHATSFLFWAFVPLLGFGIEQVLRLVRRAHKCDVLTAKALRSGVTRLDLAVPATFKYRPGDYAFLRIPAIAKHEWHPFTISSAPESGNLTFHVRSLGNWTSALRKHVEGAETNGGASLVAYVDGPYGSPAAHIFNSRNAVFIGAGIGVTPFASVLESLVLQSNNAETPTKLEKAHFFWLNKDQHSFDWFRTLLTELEHADQRALLDIHLCMTGGRSGATALGLELARELMHEGGYSDIVTGLRTHTHMGHPDWEQMLSTIKQSHDGDVDVYFCGPPGLGKKVEAICIKLGLAYREEKF
jgi:predicted ferric reductase/Ca2+-binding EF-hand superfamily protein